MITLHRLRSWFGCVKSTRDGMAGHPHVSISMAPVIGNSGALARWLSTRHMPTGPCREGFEAYGAPVAINDSDARLVFG